MNTCLKRLIYLYETRPSWRPFWPICPYWTEKHVVIDRLVSIGVIKYKFVVICLWISNGIKIACVELLTRKPPLFFWISCGFPVVVWTCIRLFSPFSLSAAAIAISAAAAVAAACFLANDRPTDRANARASVTRDVLPCADARTTAAAARAGTVTTIVSSTGRP